MRDLFQDNENGDGWKSRLRRFFLQEGDHYRVRRELRDIVLFAAHSLLKDPPFSRIDLISCRNLLIYLDRELQQLVCSTFHYSLNPGGCLLLGNSETADNPPGLFRSIDRKARIYQTTVRPGDKPRLLPRLLGGLAAHEHYSGPGRAAGAGAALNEAAMHRQALEKAAPPSVLVDPSHRVVHLSERAGRFLQPMGGPFTGDMVDLVRPELRFELRSALHRALLRPADEARRSGEAFLARALKIHHAHLCSAGHREAVALAHLHERGHLCRSAALRRIGDVAAHQVDQ